MSPKARIVFALALTITLVTLMVTMVVSRALHWQERGMVGLTYIKVMPDGTAQPSLFAAKPGGVFITYPKSSATAAGIRSGDEILFINGIALNDRLTRYHHCCNHPCKHHDALHTAYLFR